MKIRMTKSLLIPSHPFYSFLFLLLISSLVISHWSLAYAGGPGTTTATFLKLGAGPKGEAMGGAYTAIADDTFASYWNPAGFARFKQKNIGSMYMSWISGISYAFVGYGHPSKLGTLGVSYGTLQVSGIERRDSSGNLLETFGSADSVIALSYAGTLRECLSIGVNAKLISLSIGADKSYGVSTSGLAVDLGLLCNTPIHNLSLGAVVQNIGGGIKFETEYDSLPLTYRLGLAYRTFQDRLLLAADLNQDGDLNNGKRHLHFGGDFAVTDVFSIRAGYRTDYDSDLGLALSYGIGLNWRNYKFDFAYVPYKYLDSMYRFSLQMGI